MRKLRAGFAGMALTLALGLTPAAAAEAADITVTSNLDNGTGCTLREAIASANTGSAAGCANGAGADRIVFDATQFPPGGGVETITLASSLPSITTDVTIEGYGMDELTVDGAGTGRVFAVSSAAAAEATISGMTVTGGLVTGTSASGAGIQSFGTLALDDVCVCGNVAAASSAVNGTPALVNGAGIQAFMLLVGATTTITDSVVADNDATATQSSATAMGNDNASVSGAGLNAIGAASGHVVTISNSTFSDNDATATKTNSSAQALASGGGALVSASQLIVDRSTFNGNDATADATATATGTAGAFGGAIAIFGAGSSSIGLSTITDNRTDIAHNVGPGNRQGGGVYMGSGTNPLSIFSSTVARNGTSAAALIDGKNIAIDFGTGHTIENSIVSDPLNGGGNCFPNGLLTSVGYTNDYTPSAGHVGTCGFGAGTNTTVDPLLDPAGLAANGGATETIALQSGSPMIDQGSDAGQSTPGIDQRGSTRPSDFASIANAANGADIGAFELQAPPATTPPPPATTPPVTNPPPAATGKRAAALKKCKKKKSKNAKKKCIRKAKRLPV